MSEGDDLDDFIQQQKKKLAQDRHTLSETETQHLATHLTEDSSEGKGLALDGYKYEEKRKTLLAQKRKEYNDILSEQNPSRGNQSTSQVPRDTGLVLDGYKYEQKRKQILEDKRKEYNRIVSGKEKVQTQSQFKENLPPKPDTPEVGIINKLGGYESEKKKLQEERKREYNRLLAEKSIRGGHVPVREKPDTGHRHQQNDDGEYYATLPGLRDHSSADTKKKMERNMEYNELLRAKSQQSKFRPQFDRHTESGEDDYGHPPPRRGWTTPTYDEILEKKRKEEKNYRRHYDPEFDGLRSSRSETNLNKPLFDEDRRFQYLDKEYEKKKVRFEDETKSRRLLEDPSWLDIATSPVQNALLNPYFMDSNSLTRLKLKYDAQVVDQLSTRITQQHVPGQNSRSRSQMDRVPPSRVYNKPEHDQAPSHGDIHTATLPIGKEHTASADQRRKDAYRRELQRQMQSDRELRDRGRQEDLRVNATGAVDVGRRPERQQLPTERRGQPQYQENLFSPRSSLFDDRLQHNSASILENGFSDLYEPYHLAQPSSYTQPNLQTTYQTPLDEAYNYYANRHPLETQLGLGGLGLDPKPNVDIRRMPTDSSPPKSFRPEEAPVTMPFPVNDRSQKLKDNQRAYQEELKRQIEEQKQKKVKEQQEKERYEKKLDAEIANYDPFGRGGGGAPMKDQFGNVIANWKQANTSAPQNATSSRADLREMHHENQDPNKKLTPRQPPPPSLAFEPAVKISPDKETFERGGHGIFGEPMTDVEKLKRNRYQDELRNQMEEKKKALDREKELQRQEDEKLLRKIEEDNKKMQEELEEEKRKERAKQEAAQKQQEELRRQQEEKKKEDNRKRQEADDKRQDELRRQEEDRRKQREREQQDRQKSTVPPDAKPPDPSRLASPPIPTLQPKLEKNPDPRSSPPIPVLRSKTEPPASPPLPAQRTQSRQSRVASADVLNQLARMRQQLQHERKRVESDLKKEQDEPEVYDARLHKPPNSKTNIDIFEVARNKEPVTVRRHPSEANTHNVKDFQGLKHKVDRDSRSDFRKLFPNTPASNDDLETQQRVLLKQQEESISDLKQRRDLNKMSPYDLGLLREGSSISATLLQSDSAFIDIPNGSRLSNARNESARSRRRLQSDTPKSTKTDFGSVTSLDPDKITQRNDERLRRLKSIADDDVSLASADPEDILDRFMAKQQHTRPPSGQTLVDDSWLRPGTRVT